MNYPTPSLAITIKKAAKKLILTAPWCTIEIISDTWEDGYYEIVKCLNGCKHS